MIALKYLLVGIVLGAFSLPPTNAHGIGWANAPCAASGRTISEDVYERVYVRDCTWVWDAEGGRMKLGAGLDGGPATNVWVHFKASARCPDAEWVRRVVIGRERRAVCQHRGGEARPVTEERR